MAGGRGRSEGSAFPLRVRQVNRVPRRTDMSCLHRDYSTTSDIFCTL